jgi:pimeloyl-ACP methyl ester carboxylesterase
MASEDFSITIGKYDYVWATHERGPALNTAPTHDTQGPLVVMLHSFPGDSKSYGDVFKDIAALAAKAGLHSLRFDFRGCGQSDKNAHFFCLRTAHEDVMAVLHWAEKSGYAKFIFVAEGLGAAIALTALSDAVRAKTLGLAFLWPIIEAKDSWLTQDLPEIGADLRAEIQKYTLMPMLARVTMPILVQHGTEDDKAAPLALETLSRYAGTDQFDIMRYTGGGHGLKTPAERAQVLRNIYGFFQKIPDFS